ncbi:MAG: phytoene/squalene synthase family protein [Pseudomonadota bacterium]
MGKLSLPHADVEALRAIIRHGSLSFYTASRLLPADVRDGAFAIYAFCRMSDDTIDCPDAGPDSGAEGLAMLHKRLDAAYSGRPFDTVIDRCFADVVTHHGIPQSYPAALLEGFAWDIGGRRYETLADVRAYAARVAGTVGAMMAVLMGARSRAAIARACDLGTAMQLTNIARDVGEDARNGRLYLPEAWLREAAIHPADWLDAPEPSAPLRVATRRLLKEAERLYHKGFSGLEYLPSRCRPAIKAAGLIYREIGSQIAANGFDSVTRRAVVPGSRKLQLVMQAWPLGYLADTADASPPLPESQFLVDALPAEIQAEQAGGRLGPGATMLDLLLTLKAREQDLLSPDRVVS